MVVLLQAKAVLLKWRSNSKMVLAGLALAAVLAEVAHWLLAVVADDCTQQRNSVGPRLAAIPPSALFVHCFVALCGEEGLPVTLLSWQQCCESAHASLRLLLPSLLAAAAQHGKPIFLQLLPTTPK